MSGTGRRAGSKSGVVRVSAKRSCPLRGLEKEVARRHCRISELNLTSALRTSRQAPARSDYSDSGRGTQVCDSDNPRNPYACA